MFVQVDSARVGALLAGEVVNAEPAAEGGLRLHCIGRGWASMAMDDGSPLLIPLSRELRRDMFASARQVSDGGRGVFRALSV